MRFMRIILLEVLTNILKKKMYDVIPTNKGFVFSIKTNNGKIKQILIVL